MVLPIIYTILLAIVALICLIALILAPRWWKLIPGIILVLAVLAFLFLVRPMFSLGSTDTGCESANLNLTTGGEVHNNLDDGDPSMGTIIMVTRDNPSHDPVLFVIMSGASLDVEYEGKMFFTTDRFNGTVSVETATCLAEELHPGIERKIVIGSGSTPSGWSQLDDVDGWWTATTWLYQEDAIRPEGMTASEGIFVSAVQLDRDLVTKDSEVIYGQFWTETNPGYVVHIQVRPNQTLTIPQGWQGTYWVWTGDLSVGESSLQKRMIQATFIEVVDRDDIVSVTLLACGPLSSQIDESLLSFKFRGNEVTWVSDLDGWTCK